MSKHVFESTIAGDYRGRKCRTRCDRAGKAYFDRLMAKQHKIWKSNANPEDFAAAQSYLTLFCSSQQAKGLVRQLRRRSNSQYKAKDLLRASGLPLLPREESHVAQDLKRIEKGKTLSPVLLVRGNLALGRPLVIADGYHRVCAVYYFDEDEPIACRIAGA